MSGMWRSAGGRTRRLVGLALLFAVVGNLLDSGPAAAGVGTVSVNIVGGGTTNVVSNPPGISCGSSGGQCSASFPTVAEVILTASTPGGSTFGGWQGPGCFNTAGSCTVTSAGTQTVKVLPGTAYTLNVDRTGTGSGRIRATDGLIDCGVDCGDVYANGTFVTLEAIPDQGSTFGSWTAPCTSGGGTSTSCVLQMTIGRHASASFTGVGTTPLTVVKNGAGSGTVTSTPAGISCGSTCSAGFTTGSLVSLTASPAAGSTFTGWSGGGCAGTGGCSVSMSAAQTVTATFGASTASLSVDRAGTGVGTVTSNPSGITCGTDCTEAYVVGTTVTLTAAPDVGSTFGGWTGGGCSGTGTCTTQVNAATAVTATFTASAPVALSLAKAGGGGGTVTSSPAGISCGADCSESYAVNTSVTLSATPVAGSFFTGWSGSGISCAGTGACTVVMSAARTVTATFTRTTFVLTVARSGGGAGTVASSPAGISCGADCSEGYPSGSVVTLTATPASGSGFAGWTGGGCGSSPTCNVTVDAAKTVTASFNPFHVLTAAKSGNGTGTVTSSPGGITCGGDCSEAYSAGTSVTLTATSSTGSLFGGWSGGACSGTAVTCTTSVTAAVTVTASFTLGNATLTAQIGSTGGNATGRIVSSPSGISCLSDCTETYPGGTEVQLSALPANGSRLSHWSEGCNGTVTPCRITVSRSTNVVAWFETAPTQTLTVAKAGTGTGLVRSTSVVGIDCGSDCSEVYAYNTAVTLTASTTQGNLWGGWSGACSGSSFTCTVVMSDIRNVSATFHATSATGTVNTYNLGNERGRITSNPPGIDCGTIGGSVGTDCQETFVLNTVVTLTATGAHDGAFSAWSHHCAGTTGPICQFTIERTGIYSATATWDPASTLTVTVSGNGSVTSVPAGISCSSGSCKGKWARAQVVALYAVAANDSQFAGWSNHCTSATDSACTVSLAGVSTNQFVTASFSGAAGKRTLDVRNTGVGLGTLVSNPAGIDCALPEGIGRRCAASYASGASVTLTATPNDGSTFTGWGGACSGTATACTVSMSAARSVTASWTATNRFLLSVTKTGAGRVTSSPAGVDCSLDCEHAYASGTTVTLTAAPVSGFKLGSWSGACAGSAATCNVAMTQARSVTAAFIGGGTLNVEKLGTGVGTITVREGGISCGDDCTGSYAIGQEVTLIAEPGLHSRFVSWGPGCTVAANNPNVCIFSVNALYHLRPTFDKITTATTVTKAGSGGGVVTSSPAGISCGVDCVGDFPVDGAVTLTAVADAGSRFDGWSGGCSGTGTCTLATDVARNVTATFTRLHVLEVLRDGSGSGSVTSSPSGISCGADCTESYVSGVTVTLTATPAAGSRFAGWTGGVCSGTSTCTVSMTEARSVTAAFTRMVTITVSRSGSGFGTVTSTPAGVSCGTSCRLVVPAGTQVTLTPTPDAGSDFTSWSGVSCSTVCSFLATSNKSVTGVFTSRARVSIGDAAVVEGDSGTRHLHFTVSIAEPSAVDVVAEVISGGGTASVADHTPLPGLSVRIPAGRLSAVARVVVKPDGIDEADETVSLQISQANVPIARGAATGTIIDDDTATLSIGDASVVEGDSGVALAHLTVRLSSPSAQAVTVSYSTSGGTATAGADHTARTAVALTIPAGAVSGRATVSVRGDEVAEADETVGVVLAGSSVPMSRISGTLRIIDDEAVSTGALSIGDATVVEGGAGPVPVSFLVSLPEPAASPVTFRYTTSGGTATSGADFSARSATASIAAGQRSVPVVVNVFPDGVLEGDETFSVVLSEASVALARGSASATILDDDVVTVSVGDASVVEGQEGTRTVTFGVTLSSAAASDVSVGFRTADGSAVVPGDYGRRSTTTATVLAGAVQVTVSVQVRADLVDEPDELFSLILVSSSAPIERATGTGTILDDDEAP